MSMGATPERQPGDEAARLHALRNSGLLDSGSDMRLDAIVHRAAMLFNVPMAAVSLLDETRQVFRSSVGLGLPYTPRDLAFCGYAILGTDPFVVLNAKLDSRFADNPLVQERPGIRFYAGAPVHGREYQPFGALCVMDRRERLVVEPEELSGLCALAAEVSRIFSAAPMELKPERGW
jgi:GAF domain-containing protein